MTVGELLERMDSYELTEWIAYLQWKAKKEKEAMEQAKRRR